MQCYLIDKALDKSKDSINSIFLGANKILTKQVFMLY
jgi:hypothetical protein